MKEKVYPVLPALDQIIEGLQCYGLLTVIRDNPQLFEFVLCPNSVLAWTYDKFEDFVTPTFSEDGSSSKSLEINTFKAFMDSVEKMFYEGILF